MSKPNYNDQVLVRYLVADVARSIAFYCERLGFQLVQQAGPAFASVSRGRLTVLLSGLDSSGARPLRSGRAQAPGGDNRIVLAVEDLAREIEKLEAARVSFRNGVESGPGGKQIQIEDPDGNPIELHELA